MICSITDCGKSATARGWCQKHYMRWKTHGDPLRLLKAENGEPVKWILDNASRPDGDCLIWPYGRAGKGYAGPVHPTGTRSAAVLACRYMCELAHGPAPSPNHEAAHSCGRGTSGCIHPKHLRWATASENEADKAAHGTRLIGADHPVAKLNENKVRAIRVAKGSKQSIADRFGVSRNAIRQVMDGKTWSHVR